MAWRTGRGWDASYGIAYCCVQPCAARIVVTFNVRCDIPDMLLPLVFPVVLRDVFPPAALVDVPAVPVEVPAVPVEVPPAPVDVPAAPVDVPPAPAVAPPVADVPAPDAPDVLRPDVLLPDALLPIPDSGARVPTISTH